MTYKQIAELGGIKIHRCEKEWGGTWGYSTITSPNCEINGFKNEKELIRSAIRIECGLGSDGLGELCLKLLLKHKPNNKIKYTINP